MRKGGGMVWNHFMRVSVRPYANSTCVRALAYSCVSIRYMYYLYHACCCAHYQITAALEGCNNGSSGEDCVPCAGGRGCPLPLLKRKLLSALTRNKSFIWFVVFLTKGSWSRNKALLSIPSAPILLSAPQHTLPDTVMQVETRSHLLAGSHFSVERN